MVLGRAGVDGELSGRVTGGDLGAAGDVGGVQIALGRIRRENSQRAGLGRRIREL